MTDSLHPLTGRLPVQTSLPVSRSAFATTPEIEAAARDLEAAFLAEMLKHARLGEAPDVFGGGAGEEQFAGFLREAQAREIAKAGGIGITEFIVRSLEVSVHGE